MIAGTKPGSQSKSCPQERVTPCLISPHIQTYAPKESLFSHSGAGFVVQLGWDHCDTGFC